MTHNISAGGAFFTIDQSLPLGQKLICKLNFPGKEIDCKAEVVRLGEGFTKPLAQMAVVFQWNTEQERQFVEEFTRKFKIQKASN